MNNNNKLIIQNSEIRTKQKNLIVLEHLIKFKKYRRKCKDILDKINIILAKNISPSCSEKMQSNDINNDNIYDLIIFSNKLKLHLLHMAYYFNKIAEFV